GMVFGPLIYGPSEVPIPMQPLPLWGALFSLLVWPIIWAVAEDLTYFGYALPRVEVLSGRAWLAMFIVSFSWGLQHIALPIIDWRWAIYRFTVPFLLGIIWSLFYFRLRRLVPFTIAHWAMNFASVLTLVVLPLMAR
ncbi:type II CAAX prenyl endopeptidase Rce1 family protein, partial [Chloroflexota bacterium]